MSGCEKCSGQESGDQHNYHSDNQHNHQPNENDCCGGHDHSHSYSTETSSSGCKLLKYSATFIAGLVLAFYAFQPSRVYKMDIDQDGVLDVVVERSFTKHRSFFKGVKEAEALESLNPSDGLSWDVMNLRFEAGKEVIGSK